MKEIYQQLRELMHKNGIGADVCIRCQGTGDCPCSCHYENRASCNLKECHEDCKIHCKKCQGKGYIEHQNLNYEYLRKDEKCHQEDCPWCGRNMWCRNSHEAIDFNDCLDVIKDEPKPITLADVLRLLNKTELKDENGDEEEHKFLILEIKADEIDVSIEDRTPCNCSYNCNHDTNHLFTIPLDEDPKDWEEKTITKIIELCS